MAATKNRQMLEAGAKAPDFRLDSLTGTPRSLKEIASQGPALIAFFKVSCPVCQYTFPFLERMYKGRSESSPSVFAISQDNAEATREFLEEFGITFPTLLDRGEQGYPASNAYGISFVPSLFLIEPNGAISWSLSGFHKKELEAVGEKFGVQPFLPGEQVPEAKSG
jgi:peroxiredoxin